MKKILCVTICFVFSICGSIFSYAEKISTDLSSNIFRIHIIANSDSKEDQELKLKIRDNILKHFAQKNLYFSNIEECIQYYNKHLDEINNIVQKTLDENGTSISFTSKICKAHFPTKKYDYFSLPTGTYNCLKIELGQSLGQNWWCVLYPNLCITDYGTSEESKELLENALSVESYNIVTSNINYKFKIVEYVEDIKSALFRTKF